MTEHRPRVLLSVAMSVDGYIDDATAQRLMLSDEADFDRVDGARADCDALMVGAETIRRDNPRLLVNSQARRAARVASGLAEHPLKATLTRSGNLDPDARFFTTGGDKVVYCSTPGVGAQRERFGGAGGDVAVGDVVIGNVAVGNVAVVDAGMPANPRTILHDLAARGVRKLMIEGGTSLHTMFLTADLVDEIQLAIAPFFVGDPLAPRFVGPGGFPQSPQRRMTLNETRRVGDMVFAHYLIRARE